MKRINIILLLVFILCLMPLQVSANEEMISDDLYFFNPETLYVSVYTTTEECLNHSRPDGYILNGFPISAHSVKCYNNYAQINIYGQNIFCSKDYITDECPITDLAGFLRTVNTDASFHTMKPDSGEIDTIILKEFKDDVNIFGFIDFQYFCKYGEQYGFIDYIDNGWFTIVNYGFDEQPLYNMMPVDEIRKIATSEALEYLKLSSLDNYHIDINIYTNADNPLGSMYVVHVYPQFPDRDVLQIDIDCMTGKIYRCSYSEQVFGTITIKGSSYNDTLIMLSTGYISSYSDNFMFCVRGNTDRYFLFR